MVIREQKINGVFEIQLEPKFDSRGFFMRIYDEKIFREYGIHKNWVQESHSFSKKKGTVRGIHFQYQPLTETKLLRVVKGTILAVATDLRIGSKTFGKSVQLVVSAKKKNMIYLPKGIGSSFCTLTQDCHLIYKMDNYFSPENYDNIKWNDPDLKIQWPIEIPSEISDRDNHAQSFKEFIRKREGIKI